MGVGMSWVKENLYQPEGTDLKVDNPVLIISPHKNWKLIHPAIRSESPEYPVMLVAPGQAVYGLQIRSYEYRHMPWDDYSTTQYDHIRQWEEQMVMCRVEPQ